MVTKSRGLAWLAAAVVLVSGCAGGSSKPDPTPAGRDLRSSEPAGNTTPLRIVVNLTGAAGTGVFLFHPVEQEFGFKRSVRVRAESGSAPLRTFFLEPQPLPLRLDRRGVFFYQNPAWTLSGSSFEFTAEGFQDPASLGSLGGNTILGLVAGFASTGPWSLQLDYRTPHASANATAPAHLHLGAADLQVLPGVQETTETANAYATGYNVRSAGWFQAQWLRTPTPNPGVRYMEFQFPNGYACRDPQAEYGAGPGPLAAGTTSRFEFAGSFRSPAGRLEARVAYAESTQRADLVVAHLAFDPTGLPAFFQEAYIGPRPGNVPARSGC